MGSDVPIDHAILLTIQWMNFNHKIIVDIDLKDDNLSLKTNLKAGETVLARIKA